MEHINEYMTCVIKIYPLFIWISNIQDIVASDVY